MGPTSFLSLYDEESSYGSCSDDFGGSEQSSLTSLRKPHPALFKKRDSDRKLSEGLPMRSLISDSWTRTRTSDNALQASRLEPNALPNKKGSQLYRNVRWILFATYQRLFSVVIVVNLAILTALLVSRGLRESSFTYSTLATATSANLLVAVLVRHELFVNLLFLAAGSLPQSTPLQVRRWAAKVYAYGGFHSGSALAAIAWYLAFAGLVLRHLVARPYVAASLAWLTLFTLLALITIAIFAMPGLRRKMHNSFETTHRYLGWTVVLLFWAQTMVLVNMQRQLQGTSFSSTLCKTPGLWCLVLITSIIVYPWLLLRHRAVRPEVLSDHAIRLHFDQGKTSHCQGLRLTDRPLLETHAFAPIPNATGVQGFSVIISDAGDWTKGIIQRPPTHIWTRGGPQYGALYVAQLFRRVVVVATGSGIAPCMSLFQGRPDLACRILWSTPNPTQTYGEGVIEEVMRADPQATIIDTRKQGRPDLVRLAHRLYEQAGAEAVVLISNQTVTKKVIYGLECRGVPAYAPIFDS